MRVEDRPGYGVLKLGFFVAMFCSWSFNGSIPLCFLHACLGWFYVVYHLIAH